MDNGPPLKDGKYDIEKIRTFGLKIPEKNYYVLGDNHAMSADSRAFGFLPEANLQGAPSLIIWPPGDRLGPPPQMPYRLFTLPRVHCLGNSCSQLFYLVASAPPLPSSPHNH